MDVERFRRIVTAFADQPADVDLRRGTLLVQLRDEVIEGRLFQKEGTIWVEEEGFQPASAYRWIVERVARVPMLADRILSYIEPEPYFVHPSGRLLDQLDLQPEEADVPVADSVEAMHTVLSRQVAGVSSLLYLTSDAGEGKTTLINREAREQAKRYKQKETDWLLIPISLGARPFMRLDDIVVAEMANKLRFMLFYDAFLELVRLNVLVPALDGFEEVFLESGTGEAVSALGNLVDDLAGSGRVLIAARKAYFEIRSFAAQSRFFDTVKAGAVDFTRLALQRWSEDQFREYASRRGVSDPAALYRIVAERVGSAHPLLTRAVLVERLVAVALDNELVPLLDRLGANPEDYFFEFVNTLIVREATKKWIDRVGDAAEPLLTTEEHHELLALVAREMWMNSTSALRLDYLDLIADIFCSEHNKSPAVTRQVKERLHQHSLLVNLGKGGRQVAFDHEDFQRFFLGEALAMELVHEGDSAIVTFLRVASLSEQTADAAANRIQRSEADTGRVIQRIARIGEAAPDTSYTKENAALLLTRLLGEVAGGPVRIANLLFPNDALRGRRIGNVTFSGCHFQPTSLSASYLNGVTFEKCQFDRLEISSSTTLSNVLLVDCDVKTLHRSEQEDVVYDPARIRQILAQSGIEVDSSEEQGELELLVKDTEPDAELAQHALRAFMRSTHLNENVFRARLGARASDFFDRVLPKLVEHRVLEEVEYRGSGRQRRYKLVVPMKHIDTAIRDASTLSDFIHLLHGE